MSSKETEKNVGCGGLILGALFVFATMVTVLKCTSDPASSSTATDSPPSPQAPVGFVRIAGHIYPGTDVYDAKGDLVGRIVAANPDYQDPTTGRKYRQIYFRYANGDLEEKEWDAVLKFPWFVKQ